MFFNNVTSRESENFCLISQITHHLQLHTGYTTSFNKLIPVNDIIARNISIGVAWLYHPMTSNPITFSKQHREITGEDTR